MRSRDHRRTLIWDLKRGKVKISVGEIFHSSVSSIIHSDIFSLPVQCERHILLYIISWLFTLDHNHTQQDAFLFSITNKRALLNKNILIMIISVTSIPTSTFVHEKRNHQTPRSRFANVSFTHFSFLRLLRRNLKQRSLIASNESPIEDNATEKFHIKLLVVSCAPIKSNKLPYGFDAMLLMRLSHVPSSSLPAFASESLFDHFFAFPFMKEIFLLSVNEKEMETRAGGSLRSISNFVEISTRFDFFSHFGFFLPHHRSTLTIAYLSHSPSNELIHRL